MDRTTRWHVIGSAAAGLMMLTMWTTTVLVEVLGAPGQIIALKLALPWALVVLVPALALTGISGARLTRGRRMGVPERKLRRMKLIAANGLVVLAPAVCYLAIKAARGELDNWFFAVQSLELSAGALNVTLMALNARDGLTLSARSAKRRLELPAAPSENETVA